MPGQLYNSILSHSGYFTLVLALMALRYLILAGVKNEVIPSLSRLLKFNRPINIPGTVPILFLMVLSVCTPQALADVTDTMTANPVHDGTLITIRMEILYDVTAMPVEAERTVVLENTTLHVLHVTTDRDPVALCQAYS